MFLCPRPGKDLRAALPRELAADRRGSIGTARQESERHVRSDGWKEEDCLPRRACSVPVVAVLGNHDHECGAPEKVADILTGAGVCMLDGQSVVIDGIGVAGVKGFAGGFGRHMLGSFGEAAIKAVVAEGVAEAMKLENAIRQLPRERSLVILHYSPIPETLRGEPEEIYPFLGSSRLAETIDRFAVSLVVHGHAHGGVFAGRTPGGTPVYNVAAHVEKPNGKPYAIFEV